MNIIQYSKSVKIQELTNQEATDLQIAIANQLFYQEVPNEEIFELCEFAPNVWYHRLKTANPNSPQDKCRHNVDVALATIPKAKAEVKRKKRDLRKIFPRLFDCSDQNLDPLYFYKAFIREFLNDLRWMSITKNNQTYFIPQNQKGNENYQKKEKWQIIDACRKFDSQYKYCYFITLTIDPKKMNLNFLDWWKEFPKHRGRLLRQLQMVYGGDYAWVNEAQCNGRPHVHILWYTNYNFTDTHFHKNSKGIEKFIDGGALFDFVHKWYDLGHIQMDINRRKNTYNYLVKYIIKEGMKDFKKALKKSKRDTEDCKAILTLICAKATRTRSYEISSNKKKSLESAMNIEQKEFSTSPNEKTALSHEQLSKQAEIEPLGSISYLKTLSNNFSISCLKKIGFYTNKTLENEFSNKAEDVNRFPEERKRNFHDKNAKSICNGCINTDLVHHYTEENAFTDIFADNFDLLMPSILQGLKNVNAMQYCLRRNLDEKETWAVVFDTVCDDLFGEIKPENPIEDLKQVLTTKWNLWIFFLRKDLWQKALQLRLRAIKNKRAKENERRLYDIYHEKFHNFLLTYSASGIKMA